MSTKAIVPPAMRALYENWRMAPGLLSDGHLFLTGFTGTGLDGRVSDDPQTQIETAFEQVGMVLAEAGLDFGAVVEMTSYHVGLRDHLEMFRAVRDRHVRPPYPAWTAIEVSGFVTAGVIVELRVIARTGE